MIKLQIFRAAVAFLVTTTLANAALATNIFKEHLDVDIDYESGALTLDYKTYTNMSAGVPLNNDDYSPVGNPVIVPIANSYVVPSSSQWACLGAAGSTVYRIKQGFVFASHHCLYICFTSSGNSFLFCFQ